VRCRGAVTVWNLFDMELPKIISGCSGCREPGSLGPSRGTESIDYVRHNDEVAVLIVKGGLYKVRDVVQSYPERISPGELRRGWVAYAPPNDIIDVLESVCCIKPRVVGKNLIYVATRPLGLTLKFARVHIHYNADEEGEVYVRKWEVKRQWTVDVRLKPLSPKLAEFVATEKYLRRLYPIEPPDRLIARYKDGSDVTIVFDDDGPPSRGECPEPHLSCGSRRRPKR